jgi:bifunctional ADP-heptose synthase (sugar kinase/adenylyltransferase)
MSLYAGGEPLHIPAVTREVYDVSGAGDTVIAALGVLLGAGAPLPVAMKIANRAAGVVVGKLGTAVATPAELD